MSHSRLIPQPYIRLSNSRKHKGSIMLVLNVMGPKCCHRVIKSYDIFAFIGDKAPEQVDLWKKVGGVPALPLPLVCTLDGCSEGFRYHFAVLPLDDQGRSGPSSHPMSIRVKAKLPSA